MGGDPEYEDEEEDQGEDVGYEGDAPAYNEDGRLD
jgi:hypothetical protein